MPDKILSVSWLNGQLKFLHAREDLTVATWECCARIEDLGTQALDLAAILSKAAEQTGYTGKNVAVVLQHPRLIHQLVDMPPAHGKEQVLYIERLVNQCKVSDEEMAWGWQPAEPIKLNKGVLLYMFPQQLQDHLTQACREAGLHLLVMVSTTVLLGNQLAELPLEDGEVALLASEIEGETAVIVGRKQGMMLSERSLRHSWQKDPSRVVLEINRTIRFVKQQFGADVQSISFFGPGAEQQAALMEPEAQVPVRLSPIAFTPFYWAEQLQKIGPGALPNLISQWEREAPRRRALARITGFLTAGLLVIPALALSTWIEFRVWKHSSAVEKMKPRAAEWQAQKDDLQRRMAELEQKKHLIQLIDGQSLPPIPGWVLTYIANITPEEFVLTELQVRRLDDISEATGTTSTKKSGAKSGKSNLSSVPQPPPGGLWSVRLVGDANASATVGENVAPALLEVFERWINQLTAGPLHLKITNTTLPAAQSGKFAAWQTHGNPSQAASKRPPFIIEGVIR